MDTRASSTTTRLSLIPVVIALLMNLVIGPLAPVFQDGVADVLAAPETVNDEQGANDEPGQKDLTQLTIDYDGLPTSVFVKWNWDEISWSGSNTGDGCALFDTDDDLFVDAAICVTISGDPATLADVRLYECTADAKVDRCTGPVEVGGTLDTTCTVEQDDTDPFDAGAEFPTDTVATCTIQMDEVAATTAELVNVCSYPSQEPNSDPSDCVLIIRDGVLHVTKVVVNDNGGTKACTDFTFQVDGGTAEAFEADCTTEVAVEPGTYSVTEPAVAGYATTYANSENANLNCDNLDVSSFGDADDIVTCTITNNDIGASLTVTKVVTNDNGGDLECEDFSFQVNGAAAVAFDATDCSNTMSVNAGTYTVTEPAVENYTTSYENCAGIMIGLGGSATCTITNDDDAPKLTLVKDLTTDDGGTADESDFTLTATGPTGFSGPGPSVSSDASFEAGTYDLSEAGPSGYDQSAWDCVGVEEDDADSVTLGIGDEATCTISNDDQPAGLIVEKIVDGGDLTCEDFSFTLNGGSAINFEADCGNELAVDAGDHTVVEPSVGGYTTTYANSLNANADCNALSIPNGESATCTITNTRDTGDLEVIKALDPTDDPGLFDLLVDGTAEATDVTHGGTTGPITLDTGTYSVGEEAGTGTALLSYDSSIECVDLNAEGDVVASGDGTELMVDVTKDSDIVCTISNTAIDVGIGKEHDETDGKVEAGDIVEFTVTVSVNVGSATNVVVTDTLPAGLTYVDGSASIEPDAIDGQMLTWNLGSLDAGTLEITYEASVDEDAAGLLKNLACLDADQNPAEICTDTTLTVPSLVVDKAASTDTVTISGPSDDLVADPEIVTWTLTWTLTDGPVSNAEIRDEIPAGFVFLDASNGGQLVGDEVVWTFPTLETSGSVSFRTTVDPETIDRANPTVNVATIDSDDTPPDEGEDDVTVVVEPPPLGGTPTPRPSLPNTAAGFGTNGEPLTVPVELLAALFLGSLGAMALANARARSRRR
jgi:uncharacterized repeat protein (TIGR01451 family)